MGRSRSLSNVDKRSARIGVQHETRTRAAYTHEPSSSTASVLPRRVNVYMRTCRATRGNAAASGKSSCTGGNNYNIIFPNRQSAHRGGLHLSLTVVLFHTTASPPWYTIIIIIHSTTAPLFHPFQTIVTTHVERNNLP